MHSSRMHTVRSSGRISGGVPGPGGVYLVLGGCTWSGGVCLVWGVYLVSGVCLVLGGVPGPGDVPGPRGVPGLGGLPGPRGCTWSQGGVPGPGGRGVCAWSGGVYLVPGDVPGPGAYLVRYSPLVDRQTPVKT